MSHMWNYLKVRYLNEKGQGMVEYGLILALISIAAILVMPDIGTAITGTFNKVKAALPAGG